MRLALADQVADRGGRDEDLAGGDAAGAVGGRQQLLGDDALQRDRELHADLLLLLGREDVDDAVDRLRRVLGVERREDEVAGLRRGQRGRGSSRGRASRRRGSRRGPGAARPSGATAKDCASEPSSRWLTMHFLCGCRNSIGSSIVRMWSSRVRLISSMIAASDVDLPEPVGPVTRTRPRGLWTKSWQTARQAELVDRLDLERDQAERGAERGALEVRVDAEAGDVRDRVGEVELPVGLEPLALVVREDRVDDLARVGRREDWVVLERDQPTADADHRVGARGDVEVGGVALEDLEQQVGEVEVHGCPVIGRAARGWTAHSTPGGPMSDLRHWTGPMDEPIRRAPGEARPAALAGRGRPRSRALGRAARGLRRRRRRRQARASASRAGCCG